jgi:hypothetical protein
MSDDLTIEEIESLEARQRRDLAEIAETVQKPGELPETPSRSSRLPWLMAAAAVVLVVGSVALFAMINGDEDGSPVITNAPTTTAAPPTTSTPPNDDDLTTTTEPPTLEERIVANMQGAQTEYQDAFGDSGPGVVFFHRGNWASEAFEWPFGSGNYCERATFTWSVADATSESDFTIHYDTLTENPDCIALGITRLTAVFSGSQEVDGRTVYDLAYADEAGNQPITGTRTVCSDQWDDPEPCGLMLAGFEMSTPPQG